MNTASLELCKELYELTGWGQDMKADKLELWGVAENGNAAVITQGKLDGFPTELIPAYDLGYLLRKLAASYDGNLLMIYLTDDQPEIMQWVAGYSREIDQIADTPEDAACKLAIELFKSKVIK